MRIYKDELDLLEKIARNIREKAEEEKCSCQMIQAIKQLQNLLSFIREDNNYSWRQTKEDNYERS